VEGNRFSSQMHISSSISGLMYRVRFPSGIRLCYKEEKNALSRKEQLGVMPKFDVTDEAVIDASPIEVYKAVLNEFAGVTNWWMPYLGFKLRGNMPVDREGAIFDYTVFPKSRTKSSKISATVTKIVEAKSIDLELAGDFVGIERFTFEPTDGKTKLQIRFNARTTKLIVSFVSPFVNIGKGHSDVMQKGFEACNSYLCKK
jgi:hypothetical protein